MKIYDYNGKKNICGENIKKFRRMQNITQAELAAKMQINGVIIERDSISRVEIGTRFVTDYELRAFAEILKVDIGELFYHSSEE